MIVCNLCGKNIRVENDIPREDFVEINKSWGYFSKKDGKNWKIVLCEKCMDELAERLVIPYKENEQTELL